MGILEADRVSYSYRTRYRTVPVLKEVSCSFELGKLYAIVGRSGSGKTTFLSLLAGLDLPEEGQVLYDGVATSQLNRDHYRQKDVSIVYQAFHLFPLLTALENVMYPMELQGIKTPAARKQAQELMGLVGLSAGSEKQYPKMMSGGEQQRVAIARALASQARVILADEPTGNLDTENSQNIMEILTKLAHQEGRCVILITHDHEIAAQADVLLPLKDGRLGELHKEEQT